MADIPPLPDNPPPPNIPPPEVTLVDQPRVACDGSSGIAAALGHPRQYIQIDDGVGYGECGYCDRRFVLRGGPADGATGAEPPGGGMPGMDR